MADPTQALRDQVLSSLGHLLPANSPVRQNGKSADQIRAEREAASKVRTGDPNAWLNLGQPIMTTAPDEMAAPASRAPAASMEPVEVAPSAAPGVLPQDSYDALMKRIEGKTLQGIGQQRKSADRLETLKQALMQNYSTQVDLSPLMALADSWSGGKSNLSQSYQRPETGAERLQKVLNVEQQINNTHSRISDDEINLLKTQLAGEAQKRTAARLDPANAKPTAEQWKAGGFAARMADADSVISSLEQHATDRGTQIAMSKFFPGELMGEETKKIDQAQRNFINATLRRESGAAISPQEFDNAKIQYFPQPGDTPDVLAQKAQNRQRVTQNFALEGGNAYNKIVSQNPIVGSGGGSRAPGGGSSATKGRPSFEEWKKSKGY